MAHFYQKPDGKHISDKTIPLTIGQTIPMGLWGYKLPSDEELDVIISNPAVVSLSTLPNKFGDVMEFSMIAKTLGSAKLEAKNSQGNVWAWVEFAVIPAAQPTSQGDPNREALPTGPDYTQKAEYVDKVVSGEYDPASGRFIVKHDDGTNIELDILKVLSRPAIVPMPGASIREMYVFYRDRNNKKIYPVVMDDNSTPNLVAMAREVEAALPGAVALRQIGRGILDIVDLMMMKPNMARGQGRKAWKAQPRTLRGNAIGMVNKLRRASKIVRVNLGGTGEVADAINLNPNRVASREGIPNLIQTWGENMGELFESGTIDEIVSNRLPPNTINWSRVIPGAFRVLRRNGRIIIRFQGNGENVRLIVSAMEKAGFRGIKETAGVLIEAIR